MLASSVQAVVACNLTAPRVCTSVLFILSGDYCHELECSDLVSCEPLQGSDINGNAGVDIDQRIYYIGQSQSLA